MANNGKRSRTARPKGSQDARPGIFIHCSEAFRRRLKRAAGFTGRTMSGYMLQCVLPQLERDEATMKKRGAAPL
jgi:hypothetical protein